jgi:hypothetical protein
MRWLPGLRHATREPGASTPFEGDRQPRTVSAQVLALATSDVTLLSHLVYQTRDTQLQLLL